MVLQGVGRLLLLLTVDLIGHFVQVCHVGRPVVHPLLLQELLDVRRTPVASPPPRHVAVHLLIGRRCQQPVLIGWWRVVAAILIGWRKGLTGFLVYNCFSYNTILLYNIFITYAFLNSQYYVRVN